MRVATWNTNNVVRRLDLVLDWLARTKPDVVALQELKTPTAAFPVEAFAQAGYHSLVVGQRTWNGVALLSRGQDPLPVLKALPGDAKDDQARYVEAAIAGVLFGCLYLPNGNPQPGPKFDYKLRWFERMKARAAELWATGKPVVLLGDWNVVPTDADIYKPDTWRSDALLQPGPRAAFAEILRQGWTDALEAAHPGGKQFTYWDYRRMRWERNAGLRIDHILLSSACHLVDAGVDRDERGRENCSDHAPVWAEVELSSRRRRRGPAKRSTRASGAAAGPASDPESLTRLLMDALPAPLPAKLAPQLATLATAVPAGEWVIETKLDGYRMLARVDAGRVQLLTRNGHDWTKKLQHIADAVAQLGLKAAWLDSEIVVLNDAGLPDFNGLQNAIDNARTKGIVMFVFDLPFLDGKDLRPLPLTTRREALRRLLASRDSATVRFNESFDATPADMLEAACKLGLEGVMAKRADATYSSGRTDTWLKLKCAHRQEFVVVGYTLRSGGAKEVGSLLLGYYEGGELRYAGSVGTGWGATTGRQLYAWLAALHAVQPAFEPQEAKPGRWSKRAAGTERWVQPTLVVEVAFAEWTPERRLRHAVFRGVRTDKPASEIVMERAKTPSGSHRSARVEPSSTSIKVSNPDRVIDPSTGLRKVDLVRYYEGIAEHMLPHLRNRPVSLVRAPSGITGELFYQKHTEAKMPGVRELDAGLWPGHASLLAVDTAQALVAAAQMNVVELHTWNSVAKRIDKPDRFILDLDPGEGVTWQLIQEAAMLTRSMLNELGLDCWLKTSGGKGLHVVVPLTPSLDYEAVKAFSQAVVRHMAKVVPSRFVAQLGPRKRVGKVFIDYLRNGHAQTTACAFSARARPGLGVSMPVAWDELADIRSGDHWSIATALDRLHGQQLDPWAGFWRKRQTLAKAIRLLAAS